MDSTAKLEARIRSLELSRNRTRVAAWTFGIALALVSAAAMTPQAVATPQEAQTAPEQEETQTVQGLSAQRITLTSEAHQSSVVLVAGPESSLVIQDADGNEIARIGGPSARHTR